MMEEEFRDREQTLLSASESALFKPTFPYSFTGRSAIILRRDELRGNLVMDP
jgi:hypothetical protein